MARYYGPRRAKRASIPPSVAEEWFGKIMVGIMSASGIAGFGWLILCALYVLFTEGIPTAYHAVANWGNDVLTTVNAHNWQYTDASLYGGIVVILVFRYSRFFRTPERPN